MNKIIKAILYLSGLILLIIAVISMIFYILPKMLVSNRIILSIAIFAFAGVIVIYLKNKKIIPLQSI